MLMMSAPSANSFKIAGSLIMYLMVINTINPIQKKNQRLQLLSLACAIHCIITPLFICCVPYFGHVIHNPIFEISIMTMSISCGILVIHQGYCTHQKSKTIFLFIIGIILWIAHLILEMLHIHGLDLYILILGSCFVVGSYYSNHKLLNRCSDC